MQAHILITNAWNSLKLIHDQTHIEFTIYIYFRHKLCDIIEIKRLHKFYKKSVERPTLWGKTISIILYKYLTIFDEWELNISIVIIMSKCVNPNVNTAVCCRCNNRKFVAIFQLTELWGKTPTRMGVLPQAVVGVLLRRYIFLFGTCKQILSLTSKMKLA